MSTPSLPQFALEDLADPDGLGLDSSEQQRRRELVQLRSQTSLDQDINKKRGHGVEIFGQTIDVHEEIRLLRVHLCRESQDQSPPIECSLEEVNRFASKVPWTRARYIALSYEWDPAYEQEHIADIYINKKPFSVRRNLFTFLHTMRQAKNEGPFWIDAICINQLDKEEKATQLQLMPQIYQKASLVIFWLRTDSTSVSLASFDFETCHQKLELMMQESRKPTAILDYDDRELVSAYTWIITHSYWYRLWIIQEFLLADKVEIHTGPVHWTLSELQYLRAVYVYMAKQHREDGRDIPEAKDTCHKKNHSLHEVIHRWCEHDCSEPHDKVYGLIGLVSSHRIIADYNKSLDDL